MPKIYSIIVDEHIHYRIENHCSICYIEICCKEYTTKKITVVSEDLLLNLSTPSL